MYRCLGDRIAASFQLAPERVAAARQYQYAVEAHGVGSKAHLGDIGVPPDPAPMDFSAWFEAYLGDRWYTFDARHNKPRIGRILMARGRDATDVAMVT